MEKPTYLEIDSQTRCVVCKGRNASVLSTEPFVIFCSDCLQTYEENIDFEFDEPTDIESYTKETLRAIHEAEETPEQDTEGTLSDDEVVTDDMLVELYRDCGIDKEQETNKEPEQSKEQKEECECPIKNVERASINMKPSKEFKEQLSAFSKETGESMTSIVERVIGSYIQYQQSKW